MTNKLYTTHELKKDCPSYQYREIWSSVNFRVSYGNGRKYFIVECAVFENISIFGQESDIRDFEACVSEEDRDRFLFSLMFKLLSEDHEVFKTTIHSMREEAIEKGRNEICTRMRDILRIPSWCVYMFGLLLGHHTIVVLVKDNCHD